MICIYEYLTILNIYFRRLKSVNFYKLMIVNGTVHKVRQVGDEYMANLKIKIRFEQK